MSIFRRRPIGTDANEIAMHVAKHSGGSRITAIGTVIALVFSAYSLWEASLKQAKLEAYVTGVGTYTRDATDEYLAPGGGFLRGAGDDRHRHNTTARVVASRFSFRPKRVPVQSIVDLVTAISSEVRAETRMSLSRSRSREGIVYLSFRSNFDAFHRVS
jgi:hypothetical protein